MQTNKKNNFKISDLSQFLSFYPCVLEREKNLFAIIDADKTTIFVV